MKGGGDRAAAEDIARMRVVKFEGPPPAGGAPAARAGASLGERLLGELAPDELRAAGVSFTGGGGETAASTTSPTSTTRLSMIIAENEVFRGASHDVALLIRDASQVRRPLREVAADA